MIALDSIKLQIPNECIMSFSDNDPRMLTSDKSLGGDYLYTLREQKGLKDFGVKSQTMFADKFNLCISAKVLLDDYSKGININTIEQAFQNIKKVSAFDFNINDCIDKAEVLTCDVTQNITPEHPPLDCVEAMLLMKTARNTTVNTWTKRHNTGVEIDRSIQTEKRRLIMYDKIKELMRKSAYGFLHNCKDGKQVQNSFTDVLRVEQNLTSKKSMRTQFKVIDNNLLPMLNSVENPNHNVLKKVMTESKQLDIFNEIDYSQTINEFIKVKGIEQILKECHYDFDIVASLFNRMQKDSHKKQDSKNRSTRRYVNQFKDVYQQMMQKRFLESHHATPYQISQHILELLKSA